MADELKGLPCEVPLCEKLERIPNDAVLQWTDADQVSHSVPVGRLAHHARAEVLRLERENERLREVAQVVLDGLNERIESAPSNCVPVFGGIADLAAALSHSSEGGRG